MDGQALNITCRYHGSGAGNLTWIGPAIRQHRARIISREQYQLDLQFSALSVEDNGIYVCLFVNEAATIDIIVESEYVCVVVKITWERT